MAYVVLGCRRCGSPRVAQADSTSAQCHECGAANRVDEAEVFARVDSLEAAREALGQVNADRADGDPPDERPGGEADGGVTPRDDVDRALAQAREVPSERRRARLAAEGLTRELGTFTAGDWVEAMNRLDVDEARAREYLRRLARASVVAEPEHGTYRAVE